MSDVFAVAAAAIVIDFRVAAFSISGSLDLTYTSDA
jgi:hypothetical protein